MRVGMGYDVHRLCENRDMIIGGVKIDYEKGLLGHSDADVLLHFSVQRRLETSESIFPIRMISTKESPV